MTTLVKGNKFCAKQSFPIWLYLLLWRQEKNWDQIQIISKLFCLMNLAIQLFWTLHFTWGKNASGPLAVCLWGRASRAEPALI